MNYSTNNFLTIALQANRVEMQIETDVIPRQIMAAAAAYFMAEEHGEEAAKKVASKYRQALMNAGRSSGGASTRVTQAKKVAAYFTHRFVGQLASEYASEIDFINAIFLQAKRAGVKSAATLLDYMTTGDAEFSAKAAAKKKQDKADKKQSQLDQEMQELEQNDIPAIDFMADVDEPQPLEQERTPRERVGKFDATAIVAGLSEEDLDALADAIVEAKAALAQAA